MGFQASNWGFSDGDPIFEEDTEASDSEVESTGGCSNECDAELGDPCGVYWNAGFTPCAIPS